MTLTIQKSGLHYIFMTKFLTKIMQQKSWLKTEKRGFGRASFFNKKFIQRCLRIFAGAKIESKFMENLISYFPLIG